MTERTPHSSRAYVPTAVRDMNVGEMADLYKSADRAVRAFIALRFRATDANAETFLARMRDLAVHVGIEREAV